MPLARNKLMVRLENLADKFDEHKNATLSTRVNLEDMLLQIYATANQMSLEEIAQNPPSIHIEETGLTYNQPMKHIEERRKTFTWRGEDDFDGPLYEETHRGEDWTKVELRPQDIRTFVAEFEAPKQELLI
jgi:hypothetical protein